MGFINPKMKWGSLIRKWNGVRWSENRIKCVRKCKMIISSIIIQVMCLLNIKWNERLFITLLGSAIFTTTLTWLRVSDYYFFFFFWILNDWSLLIDSSASSNCFNYRNFFQDGVTGFVKNRWRLLSKNKNKKQKQNKTKQKQNTKNKNKTKQSKTSQKFM